MPQTTGSLSFKDVKIEMSIDGSSWTNISGIAREVTMGGGDRQTAETFTADTDVPIITKGKRGALDVSVKGVYTEVGGEWFETVRAAYENGTPLYVRWSPKGGLSTNYQFTTDVGTVTGTPYPVGDAGSADAIPLMFTIKTAKVTKSVVA